MKPLFPLLAALLLGSASVAASQEDWHAERDAHLLQERTRIFAQDLEKVGIPGRLESCQNLVRVREGAHGSSWGAVCILAGGNKNQRVLLCDDEIVGHFGIKYFTFAMTDDYVAEFTTFNCIGG